VNLINWLWLEDLLVRASEAEIRAFAAAHPDETFFAACLEFDGLAGTVAFSYGSRDAVEAAAAALQAESSQPVYYRAVELQPQYWRYRLQPAAGPDRVPSGCWQDTEPILERYRESMEADLEPEVTEFLWLRFEYLAECVLRRLLDRAAFSPLPCEAEFLAFSGNDLESLEELEDRLEKLYPRYRRATVELSSRPRLGELPARRCQGDPCPERQNRFGLVRCTYCQRWLCATCEAAHSHPELFERVPFFIE
jgi:hypothetical protein